MTKRRKAQRENQRTSKVTKLITALDVRLQSLILRLSTKNSYLSTELRAKNQDIQYFETTNITKCQRHVLGNLLGFIVRLRVRPDRSMASTAR